MSCRPMVFAEHPSDDRIRWNPVADLPEVWCATLETAYKPGRGLSAFLHCVRANEQKVSIRVHLRFGVVPVYWKTEDHRDPWQPDPVARPALAKPSQSLPLLEVRSSSWLASFAPGLLPERSGLEWRHFEIVSSDAIFHVISTKELTTGYFINVE
jgi:hypothetical protein